jgi:diadenosine tetraphosphate (Ap4A) HIT family hydrolase
MKDCLFCQIVSGDLPSHKFWESATHLAFLSIFPNTEGFSVVVPKNHHSSYAFALPDSVLSELILACKQVAKVLDTAFDDVGRTGMIFEGFGVDHVHGKLFPMHGTADMTSWQALASSQDKYFQNYEGYISSHDYQRADDEKLAEIAKKLRQFTI